MLAPAIAWLAVQIVMASGVAVAAPAAGDRVGPGVWICTGAGMRLVALDAFGTDAAEASDVSDPAAACSWCQAFTGAASPEAPIFADVPSPIDGLTQRFRLAPDKVQSLKPASFRSRAPPLEFAA